ncbi:hypothetical protein CBS9595_003329 [Malassezia furfur]|nr:hypothetical protein CBS9595_003329 [Malassezia furfur]
MSASNQLPAPSLQTRLLHADEPDHSKDPAHSVAPMMSLSTTFRQPHPDSEFGKGIAGAYDVPDKPSMNVYSRYTQDTSRRVEDVLSSILEGHALTFSSGLSAALAVMTAVNPSVIAIRRGYFGVHDVAETYSRGRNVKFIDLDEPYPTIEATVDSKTGLRQGGLLVWVESPLNPTGEARDIAHYAKRAHEAKGYLSVDSTFAPPPLQNPFHQGADFVMHSGTKYFGGHSDVLAGVVATKDYEAFKSMWHDRSVYGYVLGSLESYLLLRSLRTMSLRVRQQSKNATELVQWLFSLTKGQTPPEGVPAELTDGKFVQHVYHSSLQPRHDADSDPNKHSKLEDRSFDPREQMPGGASPTFAIYLQKDVWAKYLPHNLAYFTPATSLGGVESLIEQRVLATPDESPSLVRVSTGIEEVEDLKADLLQGMRKTLADHP